MIADTGAGMLPQDIPFVFQRYYQGNERTTHNALPQEGTGLGLSICKYIIEVHQGTIAFQSKKNHGTTFYFTIPLL
ncbi:Sensor protein SrrB [compost metagenome]